MSAGKKTPLNDLLREAAAAWQARPEPRPGAPPGFATRVVALSRDAPSWELTLWTRFSFGGLAVALMLGGAQNANPPADGLERRPRPAQPGHRIAGGHAMNLRHTWLVARIVLVMVGIFTCGVWVGRMTAPLPVLERRPPLPFPPGPRAGQPPPPPPGVGRVWHLLEIYRARLELTEEQLTQIRPLLEQATAETRGLPPRAPERFARLERLHEQMAGYLTVEQQKRAQQLLEEARRGRP